MPTTILVAFIDLFVLHVPLHISSLDLTSQRRPGVVLVSVPLSVFLSIFVIANTTWSNLHVLQVL